MLILALAGFLSTHTISASNRIPIPLPTTIIRQTSQPVTTFSSYQISSPVTTVYQNATISSPVTTIYQNATTPITNQTIVQSLRNFTTSSGIITLTMITTTTTSYSPSSSSTTTTFLTSTVTVTPSNNFIVTSTGLPNFAVTTSNIVSLPQGGQTSIMVSVQSINGFSGQVMLTAPNLPSGLLGEFAPNPVIVPAGGIATSQLTLSAAKNTVVAAYTFTIMASGPGITKYVSVQLFISSRPGCLIATATYGSALSPEVQFLRNFRDHAILQTFAGSSFMMIFNDWYYSFSPQVSQYEYAHPTLQTIMRGVLYPIIGTLHVSATVFSLLSFQPEFAALASGIITGLGLGLIFFAVPTTILTSKIHKRGKIQHARWLLAAFVVLLAAFCLAELMLLPALMMFVSSSLVLLALTTGALLPTMLVRLQKK
ncbi:MAG: CFI-box-CTERM domain-containing protein [Candidatus Bathyarchaeia archaeon]